MSQAANTALRLRVKQLYKTLIFYGKEYPRGEEFFRTRCHAAFMKNKGVSDPAEIEALIGRGEYVVKEMESLYMLMKYRAMKKRYYDDRPGI